MEGVRSTRDAPPSHLRFRIESFSTLLSSSLKRYESCEFEAGDHKWKLALYPNGNKDKGIEGHISLYLVLVDSNILNKEILLGFNLLLHDHIRDKYLVAQDVSRFCETKHESGFDKFVSHKIFQDSSSGHLDNDTCVFGAEVFCIKDEPKCHCLSMAVAKPAPFKYTWKVEKFSHLEEMIYSEIFTTRDHDWKLCICPKGNGKGMGKCVSLFLHLADPAAVLPAGKNVLVEYKCRMANQVGLKHKEFEASVMFNSLNTDWGEPDFLALSDITDYLMDDTLILEAEITVLGSSR